MWENVLKEAEYKALALMDKLEIIREQVGLLDDLFESDCIDNRLIDNLGAYQHLTYAQRQLQNYVWLVKEEEERW